MRPSMAATGTWVKMRYNKIDVETRLRRRIETLEDKVYSCFHYPSPDAYCPKCKYCRITNIDASMGDEWHFKGCKVNGFIGQLKAYKKLLAEAIPTQRLHDALRKERFRFEAGKVSVNEHLNNIKAIVNDESDRRQYAKR
jgi:hypothetical protein